MRRIGNVSEDPRYRRILGEPRYGGNKHEAPDFDEDVRDELRELGYSWVQVAEWFDLTPEEVRRR